MYQRTLILAILALGATASLAASPPAPLEYGVEASTSSVTLPGSVPGLVVISGCLSCNRSPLRITAATSLLQGKKSISLAQLTALGRASPHFMMIYFVPGTPEITRIVVAADGPTSP